jgi:hypothetical protein
VDFVDPTVDAPFIPSFFFLSLAMYIILPRLVAVISVLSLLPVALSLRFGFPYGSQKVRGVNLGGWLVLEVQ